MSIVARTYTGRIQGNPDIEIDVSGSITLDAGRIPHVTADLTTSIPDQASLDALDPRTDSRISVTIDDGTTVREFDLGVRSRPISHLDGTVGLTLASDEALLQDFAPLADDLGAFDHQASLRDVIDYVLGEAIPGAQLDPDPAVDGDVTVYSDGENLFRDPRVFAVPGAAALVGQNCTAAQDSTWPVTVDGIQHWSLWLHTPTSPDSYAYILPTGTMNGLRVGETYVLSATGRTHLPQGGTFDPRARRLAVFMDVGGYIELVSDPFPAAVGVDERVSIEFTIPEGCREVFARAYHGATSGEVKWSQFRLAPKSKRPRVDDTEYFFGSKPDSAGYAYDWIGDPDVSGSRRRALIDRAPEMLVWPAGKSALDFLHPLVQVHGYRLVCDEQRNWTLRDERYRAPGQLTARYGVNVIEVEDVIDRDAGLAFDAAVRRYRWKDRDGIQHEQVDAFALQMPYTRLSLTDIDAPYPGAGRAEYAVRRAQGRGREVTATLLADWTAHAEQNISVTLPDAPIQIGTVQSVEFDLDTDRMTVLTRTTDTPLGAIALLPGTIDALTGTINDL